MINWKVRFKNKPWLLSFVAAIIAFVYQILGMLDIVPALSQDSVTQLVGMVVELLIVFGVVVDPTTSGASDSQQAMTYTEPKKD